MKRELKFRAWDPDKKEMEYCGLERVGGYHECMDHPIMQSTGLQDRNGVDIYEGDIVEFPRGSRQIIEWHQEVCAFRWRSILGRALHPYSLTPKEASHMTVIGNVYSNFNLLPEV